MSELKKMTEGELLGMTLAELGFSVSSNGMISNNDMAFDPNDAGVELLPKPQEGDVWAYELQVVEFWNIAKIHLDQACMYHIDDSGNMSSMHEAVEDMFIDNGWFLYERDGKRWPEIKKGRNKLI